MFNDDQCVKNPEIHIHKMFKENIISSLVPVTTEYWLGTIALPHDKVPPTWQTMQIVDETRRTVRREKCHVLEGTSAAQTGNRMLSRGNSEDDAICSSTRWIGWEISFTIYFFVFFFLVRDSVLVWPIFGDFWALMVLVVSVFFTFYRTRVRSLGMLVSNSLTHSLTP